MKSSVVPLPPSSPSPTYMRSSSKAVNTIASSPHRHNIISSINQGFSGGGEDKIANSTSDAAVAATIQNLNHSPMPPPFNADTISLKSHTLLQEILGENGNTDEGNAGHSGEKNSFKRRQFEARKELLYLNSIMDDMLIDLRKDICHQMGAKWQPDKAVAAGDEEFDTSALAAINSDGDNDNIVALLSLQGVKKAKRLKSNYLHHFEHTQKVFIEKSKTLAEELEVTRQKLRDCEMERSSYAAIIGQKTSSDELEIESFNRQLKFDDNGESPSSLSPQQQQQQYHHHHRVQSLASVIEKLLQSMAQDTSVQARQAMRNIRENKLSSSDGADAVNTIITEGSKKLQDLTRSLAVQLDRERSASRSNIEALSKELLGSQVLIADLTEKNLDLSNKIQEKDIMTAKSIQFNPSK